MLVFKQLFTFLKCAVPIDIGRRKNRLLKFCYVPATSAAHKRLLFFFYLLRPFTVLMKQTRQAVRAVKQSIFLDFYGYFQKTNNRSFLSQEKVCFVAGFFENNKRKKLFNNCNKTREPQLTQNFDGI